MYSNVRSSDFVPTCTNGHDAELEPAVNHHEIVMMVDGKPIFKHKRMAEAFVSAIVGEIDRRMAGSSSHQANYIDFKCGHKLCRIRARPRLSRDLTVPRLLRVASAIS